MSNLAKSILEFGTSRYSHRRRHWDREEFLDVLRGQPAFLRRLQGRDVREQNFHRMARQLAREHLKLQVAYGAMVAELAYEPPSLWRRLMWFFLPRWV